VIQKGLDKLGVDAIDEQQRGAGVSKAVEPDAWQASALEQRLERPVFTTFYACSGVSISEANTSPSSR
jgi:hypothetical protein